MEKSEKILRRLELLHPKKIDLSLTRLSVLLSKLKNPHLELPPTIHIAGTNGKGSVTSFLRNIFETAKFKVHCYTSPHLIRFNERIRINSKLISNTYLNELLEECEFYNDGEEITFFEITTAAAFLAFSRIKSDLLILETGLGGRFDATNIINEKLCSVITPISMDHMNFLGSKLELIAKEKLGIVNNCKKIILSKQKKEVRQIARNISKKKKIELLEEGVNWKIVNTNFVERNFSFNYENKEFKFQLPSLIGDHQIQNASTAIATILSLSEFDISYKTINQSLSRTVWPARMQNLKKGKLSKIIGKEFDIWLDGGHNIDASNIIVKTISQWKEKKIVLIIGMIFGKNPISFLKKIISKISLLIILPIDNHQYVMPYKIKNDVKERFNPRFDIECCLNIEEALRITKNKVKSGKILVCGSLYLAGEVLKSDGYKIK